MVKTRSNPRSRKKIYLLWFIGRRVSFLVLECKLYTNLRNQNIPSNVRVNPCMYMFIQLLTNGNNNINKPNLLWKLFIKYFDFEY